MAITKIMCMKSAENGNVAAHLKHSIAYICNEEKTENGSLVGGINCLPDFAYEQMIGTKEMFGQTGGRQGYHFIISLKPGEGTKEQMYEITRRFAEEFLGGEYEGVFSVHTDKEHLHGHLVFNSVNMVTGKKYSYKKGDWKNVIQPITNRLCEEYGLSIVAAEYSKDPVNMNRKQWEKEQSWGDFIKGDMQYCRNKAESFEEFVFLMEKLGYEVNVGVHISVKAEGMRRSRRLDTLDEEFTVQNLQTFYEQERTFKYVEPPVYHPGYALHKKPANAFQQRYYGKLYRMCVVQKCRFQYKYTRYQQDLIRMKELQEEYLFLKREGINGWEDVFRVKQSAEKKIEDIDAKKKELYNEHARYKYRYEKDGDVTVYLYHEAHYREQLAELKERRKEAKRECATINRCISESTFAHMEIPLDVDVENLYISQPDNGEQALEIAENLISSGAIDIIVIDSVAALTPKSEIEGEMGDSKMGLQARLMSQALRKMTSTISKTKCCCIFINQLRDKIGVMYGNPETTTGGNALKFYSSVRLDIRKIQTLKEGDKPYGNRVRVKIVKNKVAPPFKQVEFDLLFGEGISKLGEIIDVAVEHDVIKKSGSWFSYGDTKIGQGRDSVKQLLQDNPELEQEIEEKVREILLQ